MLENSTRLRGREFSSTQISCFDSSANDTICLPSGDRYGNRKRLRLEVFDHGSNHFSGRNGLKAIACRPAFHPGEVEQAFDGPSEPCAFPPEDRKAAPVLLLRGHAVFVQQFGDLADRGERAAEQVRNYRDKIRLQAHAAR